MQRRRKPAIVLLPWLCGCAQSGLFWQDEPAALQAYKQSFAAAVGSRFDGSASEAQFLAALRSARALWLGDDHRDLWLHQLQLSLLQRLAAEGIALQLLLEAVGEADQADVDAFLAGRIELVELRHRCRRRWPGSWLDDGEVDGTFYCALLQLARRHGWPVRAAEPTPRLPLPQRDPRIAANARDAAAADARLLVAVVGQTHLLGDGDLVARAGLPAVVLGATPPPDLPLPARLPANAAFACTDRGVWFFAARAGALRR